MSIDGGPYIAQSSAMLQHIGRLAPKLCPPERFLQVQEAIGLVEDFERAWRPCVSLALEPEALGYGITPATAAFTKGSAELQETTQALRQAFLAKELPKYCGFFAQMVARSGGPFLCGDQPTLADCALAPALERFTLGETDLADEVLGLFQEQARMWSPMLDAREPGWNDAVHTLKGSAAGVGALQVAEACAAAEVAEKDALPGKLEAVRDALDAALADVAAYRHELAIRSLRGG